MSKSVLFSIKPKYCELIASGKKTIEVRKTRPKIDVPFKGYIYCTKPNKKHQTICGCMILNSDELYRHPKQGIKYGDSIELMCCNDKYSKDNFLNGKVIGEFVCDEIIEILPDNEIYGTYDISDDEVIASCLVNGDLWNYGKGKTLYGFHISDLVIYDKPKELSEFEKPHEYIYQSYRKQNSFFKGITRPPQSWCCVEELK